jgi:site-specific recombinase XerD
MNHLTAKQTLATLIQHLEGAYAPNTLRAYRADMQEFIHYCENHSLTALPASSATVACFLMSTLSQGIKTATIRRKVSSISAIHRLSSLPDPTKHPEVMITVRKISRQLGTRFDQAYPITKVILDKLLAVCSDDLHGLRDRALLMLAYDCMRRRSELVSLRVEDMEWLSDDGVAVLLRKSKTDQHGSGQWIHLSTPATKALQDWMQAAQIKDGFILRGIHPNGSLTPSLCESRVSRIYKTLAKRAQLNERIVQSISGHSMRVGGAQDLLIQGASLPQIMVKGGWAKTDTVMRYVERVRAPALPVASASHQRG